MTRLASKALLLLLVGLAAADVTDLREGHGLISKLHAGFANTIRDAALRRTNQKMHPQGYTQDECDQQAGAAFLNKCPNAFATVLSLSSKDQINVAEIQKVLPTVCETNCVNAMNDISAWYIGNGSSCNTSELVSTICLKDGNTYCFQSYYTWASKETTDAEDQKFLCSNCGLKLVKGLMSSSRVNLSAADLNLYCSRDAAGGFCLSDSTVTKLNQLDLSLDSDVAKICKNECQRKVIAGALQRAGAGGLNKYMCTANAAGKYCVPFSEVMANITLSDCSLSSRKLAQLGCCASTLVQTVQYGNDDFNLTDYNRQVRECKLSPLGECTTKGGNPVSKSIRTNIKWSWAQTRQNQVAAALKADIVSALVVPDEYVSVALSQAPLGGKFSTLAADAVTATVTMQGQSQAQTTDMSGSLNAMASAGTLALPTTETLYAGSGVRTSLTATNPPSPPAVKSAARGLSAPLAAVGFAAAVVALAVL